jgi:hypothetical protein
MKEIKHKGHKVHEGKKEKKLTAKNARGKIVHEMKEEIATPNPEEHRAGEHSAGDPFGVSQ